MEKELVKTFIDAISFIKSVSPDIWIILVKQQIIIAWIILIVFGVSAIGVLISLRIIEIKGRGWLNPTAENVTCIIFSIVTFILLTCVFVIAIPQLLNPEYYALMKLKP